MNSIVEPLWQRLDILMESAIDKEIENIVQLTGVSCMRIMGSRTSGVSVTMMDLQ